MLFFVVFGHPGFRSPTTAVATAARHRLTPATRWTPTRPTSSLALAAALDLRSAIHVGHSTGGGEVARYVAHATAGRVAKAVLIGAVPPIMVKSETNPGGLPLRSSTAFASRSRPTVRSSTATCRRVPSTATIARVRRSRKGNRQLGRQGMIGGAKAQYDCIAAFSETDFTEDLRAIAVPVLVMHGTDDQIVPIADSALLSHPLLSNGMLKTYEGLPHGMCTTHPDVINADLRPSSGREARLKAVVGIPTCPRFADAQQVGIEICLGSSETGTAGWASTGIRGREIQA